MPFYGLAVLCLDHPHVQDILPRVPRRHVTYGVSPQSDYAARGIQFRGLETSFNAYRRGEPLGGFTVKMPGAHNVLNCLATIAVADELEVPLDVTKQALATFGGVARRFTVVGTSPRASRSSTTTATTRPRSARRIEAARRAYPGESSRVVVAFQPHRYTRTRDLFDDFTRAFNQADVLFVTDIYAAGHLHRLEFAAFARHGGDADESARLHIGKRSGNDQNHRRLVGETDRPVFAAARSHREARPVCRDALDRGARNVCRTGLRECRRGQEAQRHGQRKAKRRHGDLLETASRKAYWKCRTAANRVARFLGRQN